MTSKHHYLKHFFWKTNNFEVTLYLNQYKLYIIISSCTSCKQKKTFTYKNIRRLVALKKISTNWTDKSQANLHKQGRDVPSWIIVLSLQRSVIDAVKHFALFCDILMFYTYHCSTHTKNCCLFFIYSELCFVFNVKYIRI